MFCKLVKLLIIVWCLMFSAWRESTVLMLKLAQVKMCLVLLLMMMMLMLMLMVMMKLFQFVESCFALLIYTTLFTKWQKYKNNKQLN